MGDDIQMGQQNVAGAQTNLFARALNPLAPGDWTGDVVFNVDGSNFIGGKVDGIRAVAGGIARGVVGLGQIGVVGSAPIGHATEPGQPDVPGVGVFGEVGQAIIFPPPLPPGIPSAGIVGSASGSAVGLGVYGVGGAGSPGVRGDGGTGNADGVQGFGKGTFSGVAGFGDPSANGTGVFGAGFGPQAPGVRGIGSGGPNTVPGNAVGVYGQAGAGNSNGVEGHGSGNFAGVSGLGDAGSTANSGIGVFAVGGAPKPNSGQSGGPGVHAIGAGGPPFAQLNRAVGVFAVGGNGSFPGMLGVGGAPSSGSIIGGPGVHGVGFGSTLDPKFIGGAFGVYGLGGIDGSPGVRGDAGTDGATGVLGESNLGPGVAGFSNTGEGVSGQSTGSVGVKGFSQNNVGVSAQGSIGLVATGNQLAARFDGNVLVQGNFTVTGSKAAAVPFPDGSHRQLYCTESPESWFEDFGFGELVEGQTEVPLDPVFRSVVTGGPYHVFITEYGDNSGLYVSRRSSESFVVRAKVPAGHGAFSYRVVAKRKDCLAPRFEKVSLS